ncbi:MAG TPA: hypothetical protein VGB50_03990 [Flavobacterium sp.]
MPRMAAESPQPKGHFSLRRRSDQRKLPTAHRGKGVCGEDLQRTAGTGTKTGFLEKRLNK